jgi:hypothetical protein
VGVTGHRRLPEDPELGEAVRLALGRVQELLPPSDVTPVHLAVVSPLAEGADRMVANEVLVEPNAILETPLPFEVSEYIKDFETEESRLEFEGLLEKADVISVQKDSDGRAYGRVGRYVADYCDVLIALWDGETAGGAGGTAHIVEYALSKEYPVVWVETKPPFRVRENLVTKPFLQAFRQLDDYNRWETDEIREVATGRTQELLASAETAGLPGGKVDPFCKWILPQYARADRVAERAQARFRYLSLLLFFAGAGAVAALATQLLFAPDRPELALIEVALLLAALLALFVGRRRKFHDRWLSSRFLAERFRSALYRALSGIGSEVRQDHDPGSVRPSEEFKLGHSADEWVRRAYDEVWRGRPEASPSEELTEGLKRFIADVWIGDQIEWYERTSSKHERRHRRLILASYVLFTGTLIAALLHALGFGAHGSEGALAWSDLLVFVAVVFPAVAGAVAGLHAQRQYERNASRYRGIANRLTGARERLEAATTQAEVRAVVRETEVVMLDENLDWFGTMRFEDLRPHA